MTKFSTIVIGLAIMLSACGTEHPFDRGQIFDDAVGAGDPLDGSTLSFGGDIRPLLSGCVGCHSGGAGGWTYDGGANALTQVRSVINTASPRESALLVKGSGGDNHGGGTVFSSSSSSYEMIEAWIAAGALE
ncbi:MAG: hypothetical protein HKN32_03715 [Flavobacteriales bacterium]|nr:hypothetical protein [Flavobacteriales bacterium]